MGARTGEHGVSLAPSKHRIFDWMAKPSGGGHERATHRWIGPRSAAVPSHFPNRKLTIDGYHETVV
jgi:hypothetical protein